MTNSFEVIKPGIVTCANGCHLVERQYLKNEELMTVMKPCGWMQVSKSEEGVSQIISCDEEDAPTDEAGNYLKCGMPRTLE